MTQLTIALSFPGPAEIQADCSLVSRRPFACDVSFSLAASLQIGPARLEGEPCPAFPLQAPRYDYMPPAQRVCFPGSQGGRRLEFSYRGGLTGWAFSLDPALRSLNIQSAWRPFDFPFPLDAATVQTRAAANSFVPFGRMEDGMWKLVTRFQGDPSDDLLASNFALIDLSRCSLAQGQSLWACCRSPRELPALQAACRLYDQVLDFYQTQLYEPLERPRQFLLPFSCQEDSGGYFTPRGMVATAMPENLDRLIHWLAHEGAHAWCTGAPMGWQDWLNETTAEWSALLFALSQGKTEFFRQTIERRRQGLAAGGVIRTPDGAAPPDVHERGTILFYHLYEKYGKEAIARLLRLYQTLPLPRTTEAFLAALSPLSPQLAADIEGNLDRPDFV